MSLAGKFTRGMRPISRIAMDAYSAEMDDSPSWNCGLLLIICEILRDFSHDFWDVDDGWHETEGLVDGCSNHAIPETREISFVCPFWRRSGADYTVNILLEIGLLVLLDGKEEEAVVCYVG